jgi:hypothetical protein
MLADYASNRPEVVSVDAQGQIRTGNSPGVATISVGVQSEEQRIVTQFVVYVR